MQQLTIGTLLRGGSYKIEKVLGQGSFGITYLAEHTNLGRKVAIKEFFMKELNSRGEDGSITGMTDGSLSQNYCVKFQKEAINLSRLDHPNIVRVTDSFSENGTFYYVMDYIEGQNLNDYVKSHHVDEAEATSIIKSVADALIYMHEEKHMLHLDLKPGNVMRRNSDGHIFLIDFGLSKHFSEDGQPETSTTIGLGTAGYAPIEQGNKAKNGEFRPTIDVYALGATFYKLLTRETPPPASDLVSDDELLENNLRAKGISDNLIKIVVEAMCPNVRKRTQTIRAFKRNLEGTKDMQTLTGNDSEETIVGDGTESTIVAHPNSPVAATSLGQIYNQKDSESNETEEDILEEEPEQHSVFSFKGRISRLQYWVALFGGFCVFCVPLLLALTLMNENVENASNSIFAICAMLWAFLYYYIIYAVGAKRCHDLDHSGWFQLIPFYAFVMLFSSGDDEENEYGEYNDGISKESLKKLGIIVVIACGILGILAFAWTAKANEEYERKVSAANNTRDWYTDGTNSAYCVINGERYYVDFYGIPDGQRNIHYEDYFPEESFSGTFVGGRKSKGLLKYHNGDYFNGTFSLGAKQNGHGRETSTDYIYEGDYQNGMYHGQGTLTKKDGEWFYTGNFAYGYVSGAGRECWPKEKRKNRSAFLDCNYVQGERDGVGTWYFNNHTYEKCKFKKGRQLTTIEEGTWNW